jgi:VanZ family protein
MRAEQVVDEADGEHVREDSEMAKPGADRRRERVLAWTAVALWSAVIFSLSGDSFSADQTSRIIGPLLDFFFPGLDPQTRGLVHLAVRKLAHFGEYAVLGALTFRALRIGRPGGELRSALLGFCFVLAVAALDESGQALRTARTGSKRDVLLDATGGAAGICVALGARARMRRRSLSFPGAPVP